MMKPKFSMLLSTALLVGAGAAAHAAAAAGVAAPKSPVGDAQSRETERQAIRNAREALEQRRVQEESACYQKFVVDSCLREVRARTRTEDTALREREVELNDADRRDKAASRLQSIEAKKREQQAQQAAG